MTKAPLPDPYGTTLNCDCGRSHTIQPEAVWLADDALLRLPTLIQSFGEPRVTLLMDMRTREAAGMECLRILEERDCPAQELLIPDRADGSEPVCDEATKKQVAETLPACDLLIAVGAGVVSDLTKWVAFERERPYLTVATAASMNGYASANVAPSIGGVKTLVRAAPPRFILSTPSILAQAPHRLTASGLGDILAKSVSSMDWKLNEFLFGDYYCQPSVDLIREIEPLYLNHPESIAEHQPEALAALFHGLLLTGVAMTMAETSAPASGGEHLVSHALDMLSVANHTQHDLHGRQVGIGTVLCSALYEKILSIESPEFRPAPESIQVSLWGSMASDVAPYYAEKRPRLDAVASKLSQGNTWDTFRETLAPMLRAPETIRTCLAGANAAYRAEDIGTTHEHLARVLCHCREMRARITVLDLACELGLLPECAEDLVLCHG